MATAVEIAGVPQGLLDVFAARSREVARAAERFRAKWGRAPERGELRRLTLENRKAKLPVTRVDQRVWDEKAARHGSQLELHDEVRGERSRAGRVLEDRAEERLTERTATFEPGECARCCSSSPQANSHPPTRSPGRGG